MGKVLLMLACGLMLADAAVISPGVKAEIKGRINKRGADTLVVRDANDMDVVVLLTDNTTIKSNKKGLGVFRRGKNFDATSLLRGLMISVEGTGNSDGQLLANEIRFSEADLKDVMTVQSRVQPVEEEQKRMSGQLDETTKTANEANESADAAHKRLDSVNDRHLSLTDAVKAAAGDARRFPTVASVSVSRNGLNATIREGSVSERLAQLNVETRANTPEEFRAFVAAETAKWSRVVREAGIKMG